MIMVAVFKAKRVVTLLLLSIFERKSAQTKPVKEP